MGDGAIVEFASVVDAVACAVAIQKAWPSGRPKVPADRRIVFRIGVNLGDVVVEGDDLLGDGVNVAARLEQLCEPGGVLVSGTAYDHLQGKLGLPLEFTGEQQVKNIARPVRAYRVRLDGDGGAQRLGASARAGTRPAARAAAAALLFALVVAGRRLVASGRPSRALAKPSIAVLPFDNLGGDEATGRLADGITEDIITDLARFRDLDVIARNSTEVYKGKPVDVRQVGQDLDVGYVLEGSIQRQGDQVRVTAQLIDAAHRRPCLVGALGPAGRGRVRRADRARRAGRQPPRRLRRRPRRRASGGARKRPEDLTAYDLYLLGQGGGRPTDHTRADAEEAVRLLTAGGGEGPALRPRLDRARLGHESASVRRGPADGRVLKPPWTRRSARCELDPADADAHAALGDAWQASATCRRRRSEYDKALRLNPGSVEILTHYAGWASRFGEPERGARRQTARSG